MVNILKDYLHRLLNIFGLDIIRIQKNQPPKDDLLGENFPFDMEPEFIEIYRKCKDYTMTSAERVYALYKSVEYIVCNNIPGDVVECGVWKGGSVMAIAHALLHFGSKERKIYLYDTFDGMSNPTELDVNFAGDCATDLLKNSANEKEKSIWHAYATKEEVEMNLKSTNYPSENIIFVKGRVEDTIPGTMPICISLLRLDTDWYESTYHELQYLYPLLSKHGVLIIDDYGYWKGSRKAMDKYLFQNKLPLLLNRIDNTGRISIKI